MGAIENSIEREFALVVVWPNFYSQHKKVEHEIASAGLPILAKFDLFWSMDLLKENLFRFYGDKLATSSVREKLGTSKKNQIRVYCVESASGGHTFEKTSKGVERVNSEFFSLKKNVRKRVSSKFGIHMSNTQLEAERDSWLLFGKGIDDTLNEIDDCSLVKRDITGAEGWADLDQFLSLIGATEEYVVIRNHDELRNVSAIKDIDFLAKNKLSFVYRANAQKMSSGAERANYRIVVNGSPVDIDIRYLGDDYLPVKMEEKLLESRVRSVESEAFIPGKDIERLALIYHVLIHRDTIPEKYKESLHGSLHDLRNELYAWMQVNSVQFVEPKDVTLRFNRENGGYIKFTRHRKYRERKSTLYRLKRFFYRIYIRLCAVSKLPD